MAEMHPADVPDELVQAAAKAMADRESPEGVRFAPASWWIDDARAALAAALPLSEQQLRADRDAATARAEQAEREAAGYDRQAQVRHERVLKLEAEREQLRKRAEKLEAVLSRLHTRLGETRIEWGVQHPLFGTDYIQGADNARMECDQLNVNETGQPWRVVTRLTGAWRGGNEPDATRLERYDNTTRRTVLERVADEQGDGGKDA